MSASNLKWFLVVLVAALIVSVTWWKVSTRSSDDLSPVAADAQETATGDTSPQRLLASRRNPPVSASPEELTRFNRMRHEQTQVNLAKVVNAGRKKLVARYQSEKIDGSWATAREQSLIEHSVSPQIHDLGAEPQNLAAHCRSTTCQLSADFPTRVAADDWFTLYLTNAGTDLFNASSQMTANPDGTTHLEIYGLAKQP